MQNEILEWVSVSERCDDVTAEAGAEAHPDHGGHAEAEGEAKSEIHPGDEGSEQFLMSKDY